eukprot:TRINITY_DN7837_c0_g1_i2.p1 TRINITY_DN7837_c0_g1~~TRINITY_DN7837_c0_g1_i2.p1  ORF type:complete len:146 (-),score=24.79 TRINITY_DN7837_c0_g1_i2:177-614(-)
MSNEISDLRAVYAHPMVDIVCGVCKAMLYKKLSEYSLFPPSQKHITVELFTNIAPLMENVSFPYNEDTARIACKNRCHTPQQYWLIDHGSGYVNRRAHLYAVAVGPGLAEIHPSCPHPMYYSGLVDGKVINCDHGIQIQEKPPLR